MLADTHAANYVTRVVSDIGTLSPGAWATLLQNSHAGDETIPPFLKYDYLLALQSSKSACMETGWHAQWITLWDQDLLCAAAPLYLKDHSRGEYVFDWSWARAYEAHGLPYYPKAVIAVPFTPVPGQRLLARDPDARRALVMAIEHWAQENACSSVHGLFLSDAESEVTRAAGWSTRLGVQFHWHHHGWSTFDDFLGSLKQDKRKKVRAERRKVSEAGVRFQAKTGAGLGAEDWAFFYRCYETTYWEHGNAPYLTPAFFAQMAGSMSDNWVMFIAETEEHGPIAASLVGLSDDKRVAYGRYWGSLVHLSCLHFEACYYQPIEWCIAHGVQRFEGGAQGEHKISRALLPTQTQSAHWIANAAFADAVGRFTAQEAEAMAEYQHALEDRTPFKRAELP